MNNYRLLILGLLFVLTSCKSFQWDLLGLLQMDGVPPKPAHQSSSGGDMNVVIATERYTAKSIFYNRINSKGISDRTKVLAINGKKILSINEMVLKASDDGKHLLLAFTAQSSTDILASQKKTPCSNTQVYFVESSNGGKHWDTPAIVSQSSECVTPNSSLSMILQRDNREIFIFYASQEQGKSSQRIIVRWAKLGEKYFKELNTLPEINGLAFFNAEGTFDEDRKNHYFHLFFTDSEALYYTRATDDGYKWSPYRCLATGVRVSPRDFVAIDVRAAPSFFYVQYREKSSQKSFVIWSKDHGETIEMPIKVGEPGEYYRDAIGICGSDDSGEAILVVVHLPSYGGNGYVGHMILGKKDFVALHYPNSPYFKKVEKSYMIDCAYKGIQQFYITLVILNENFYYAHGTLNLAD